MVLKYGIIISQKFRTVKRQIGFKYILMIEWYGKGLLRRGRIIKFRIMLRLL